MRAPLSIVIPTLNASEALPACLAALIEGLNAGILREVIISDGGSNDATQRIAESAGAQVITGPPGRGGQLRRGVEAAQGAWVLVLHADTNLAPGWSEVVADRLAGSENQAFYGDLAFDRGGVPGAVVARWANLRSRFFGLPYGDQGLSLIHI